MAIEYQLVLIESMEPERALKIMLDGIGARSPITKTDFAPEVRYSEVAGIGLTAMKRGNLAPPSQRHWKNLLGTIPSLDISFRMEIEQTDEKLRLMLKMMEALFDATESDAALIYHEVLILRKSGKLIVNAAQQWPQYRLDMLSVPYTFAQNPKLRP
jgi:hypothetical protein